MWLARIFLICIFAGTAVAASAGPDSIVVKKDVRIDILTTKQAAINKKTGMMTSNGQYKGFRVQVISTSDRNKAFALKAELLSKYPEHKTYTIFQSPFFRIRIGNFLKRDDAEKFRKQLLKQYTDGLFVVADAIDYTPTDEEESELMD